MEEFRALLQERLRVRGAQARLAEMSGIKSPVIGHWARGETRPSPANLKRIAPALGVPYEELMRMCDYLPGEAAVTAVQSELHMRLVRMEERLSQYPRAVWLAIMDANERLAEALAYQLSHSPQTSVADNPALSAPSVEQEGRTGPLSLRYAFVGA